ncbi:hypothetical protein ACE6H2_024784 [Prunus campanulata]
MDYEAPQLKMDRSHDQISIILSRRKSWFVSVFEMLALCGSLPLKLVKNHLFVCIYMSRMSSSKQLIVIGRQFGSYLRWPF